MLSDALRRREANPERRSSRKSCVVIIIVWHHRSPSGEAITPRISFGPAAFMLVGHYASSGCDLNPAGPTH
jgi:hypothetical protein